MWMYSEDLVRTNKKASGTGSNPALRQTAGLIESSPLSTLTDQKIDLESRDILVKVYMDEYSSLRKEIELRLGWQMVTASLFVPFLGGLTYAAITMMTPDKTGSILWLREYSLVFGAMSIGATLLGLITCNEDHMIAKLGSYIQKEISPKVSSLVGTKILNWELAQAGFHIRGTKFFPRVSVHGLLLSGSFLPLLGFLCCLSTARFGSGKIRYEYPSVAGWCLMAFAALGAISLVYAVAGSVFSYRSNGR